MAVDSALGPERADLGFDPDALREKYRQERDKRLRADGNEQYREVKGDFSHYVNDPYVDIVWSPVQRSAQQRARNHCPDQQRYQ